MTCRYDKAAERHLLRTHLPACDTAGCQGCEPCLRDQNGDPVKHCTARVGCNGHLGYGELTCPSCIEKTRTVIRKIVDLAAVTLLEEAIEAGVDSEAAYLAGPACDPEAWSWRKVTAKQGGPWHMSLEEDDDEHHPYRVLTTWEAMLREDYKQPSPPIGCSATTIYELEGKPVWQANPADCRKKHGPDCWKGAQRPTNVTSAAKYLDGMLHRIANDETQDWALFARELRDCCNHLEAVVHTLRRPEQGVPCPECSNEDGAGPRLTKHYVEHDRTGASDWWGCVAVREHSWPDYVYRKWVADVYLEQADRLTASQIASQYGIPAGSVRGWASLGRVDKRGKDEQGRQMYDVAQARACAGQGVVA